ncbi:MAG: TerB family tellurite resistance protein [Nitrospirota bacterium]
MVTIIKQFFSRYIETTPGSPDKISGHSLQIATAALLVEMMRADADISREEEIIIKNTIKSKFKLTDEETNALLRLAEDKIWESTGYFEFTSLINKSLNPEQKIKIIEQLWEVAFADSILDKHEEYMVRRIADLIYVSHKDFIRAKLRVKKRLLT